MLSQDLLRHVLRMMSALWLAPTLSFIVDNKLQDAGPLLYIIVNAANACLGCHQHVDTNDALLIFCDTATEAQPHCAYVHQRCQESNMSITKSTCPSCGFDVEWL